MWGGEWTLQRETALYQKQLFVQSKAELNFFGRVSTDEFSWKQTCQKL